MRGCKARAGARQGRKAGAVARTRHGSARGHETGARVGRDGKKSTGCTGTRTRPTRSTGCECRRAGCRFTSTRTQRTLQSITRTVPKSTRTCVVAVAAAKSGLVAACTSIRAPGARIDVAAASGGVSAYGIVSVDVGVVTTVSTAPACPNLHLSRTFTTVLPGLFNIRVSIHGHAAAAASPGLSLNIGSRAFIRVPIPSSPIRTRQTRV